MHHFLRPARLKPSNPLLLLTQSSPYVNAKPKWKKDPFYDTLTVLNSSKDLKIILSLVHIIAHSPTLSIPASAVSKKSRILEIHGRVVAFLRKYPSFFEEFAGDEPPGHPWFRLTAAAAAARAEEKRTFEEKKVEVLDGLRRVLLMTKGRSLPLTIVKGLQWCLGLPEDFADKGMEGLGLGFRAVDDDRNVIFRVSHPPPVSVVQKDFVRSIKVSGSEIIPDCVSFQFYPSKGVRPKKKISTWLDGFQKLPYLSPYQHRGYRDTDPSSDQAEKFVVGLLHELLCLTVDRSAERRRLLCLRKHLGLPQKFGEVFRRHPDVFYLHMKNKTCYVVLKEGYLGGEGSALRVHPMMPVRERYVGLMRESEVILRRRRSKGAKRDVETQNQDVHLSSAVDGLQKSDDMYTLGRKE